MQLTELETYNSLRRSWGRLTLGVTILSAQQILKTYSNSLCARKGLAGDYDDHDGGSHCGIRYGDGDYGDGDNDGKDDAGGLVDGGVLAKGLDLWCSPGQRQG